MWLCLTQTLANRQSISVPCVTSYLILICRLSSELLSSSFMLGITTYDILCIFIATITCDFSLYLAECISGTRESLKHVQLGRYMQASGYSSCPVKYPLRKVEARTSWVTQLLLKSQTQTSIDIAYNQTASDQTYRIARTLPEGWMNSKIIAVATV
jgi:hypothetical protein